MFQCFVPHLVAVIISYTLSETSIAPDNQWLEDALPFGVAHFQAYHIET